MRKKTNIVIAMLLAASYFSGCSSNHSKEESSPTPSFLPQTGLATEVPVSTEDASEAPSISQEDYARGVAEGNPYVIYSGVMCFGGTLDSEELEEQSGSEEDLGQKEAGFQEIPSEVKEQSEENIKLGPSFEAPQECYEAGWSNPGSI